MFAAAAVAAAAALTAISTTQTSNNGNLSGPQGSAFVNNYGGGGGIGSLLHTSSQFASTSNSGGTDRPRPYISWAQYAHQRRNSLQRRKVEISKRLEKASNINNRNAKSGALPSNAKDQNNNQLLDANGNKLRPREKLIDHNSIISIPIDLHTISKLSEDDPLINELKKNVVNEFLKIHSIGNEQIDEENKSKLNQLAHDNFNLIGNSLSIGADGNTQLDINEISQLLLHFIQSENIIPISSSNPNDFSANSKLIKLNAGSNPQQQSQQGVIITNSSRWEPRWLKKLRNIISIPITLLTLVFLVITNVETNWIHLENDHRAGLWAICNKTYLQQDLGAKTDSIELTTMVYNTLNFDNNETEFSSSFIVTTNLNDLLITSQNDIYSLDKSANNKSSLLDKINKKLFQKNTEIQEDCFSKFFLKEDGQLVVLAISLVAILFHSIGLVLLFIGLVFVSSNRTLYYYHSASECLISSALLNVLDVLAFATLVSSQIEQSYNYGYCFYLNLLISFVTFFCSTFLCVDDVVNEYRSWRRHSNSKTKRRNYLPT